MTKGERKDGAGDKLYADQTLKEHVVIIDGNEYVFKYHELTWAARNRILSEALTVDTSDRGHLDLDHYQRGCLKAMIVEHPFPDELNIALIKLGEDAGRQLAKIVPSSRGLVKEEKADFTGAPSEVQ